MAAPDIFERFIVLRTGYGSVLDICGYGWTYDDCDAVAKAAIAALDPDYRGYDVWADVERRARRRRKRTVAPC